MTNVVQFDSSVVSLVQDLVRPEQLGKCLAGNGLQALDDWIPSAFLFMTLKKSVHGVILNFSWFKYFLLLFPSPFSVFVPPTLEVPEEEEVLSVCSLPQRLHDTGTRRANPV